MKAFHRCSGLGRARNAASSPVSTISPSRAFHTDFSRQTRRARTGPKRTCLRPHAARVPAASASDRRTGTREALVPIRETQVWYHVVWRYGLRGPPSDNPPVTPPVPDRNICATWLSV